LREGERAMRLFPLARLLFRRVSGPLLRPGRRSYFASILIGGREACRDTDKGVSDLIATIRDLQQAASRHGAGVASAQFDLFSIQRHSKGAMKWHEDLFMIEPMRSAYCSWINL
jgi:hypothetical protein